MAQRSVRRSNPPGSGATPACGILARLTGRPIVTFGSPLSDLELWRCANQERTDHGDNALVHALQRMNDLASTGDRDGAATWAAIILRIVSLGPITPVSPH